MFIVLADYPDTDVNKTATQVLNIFYTDDNTVVRQWINEYLFAEMESLLMCPASKDTKNASMKIEELEGNMYCLVKQFKKISRGYVYNSSEKLKETICTVRCLEFDGKTNLPFTTSQLYTDVNTEVNNRVLKQLDQASLYQVVQSLHSRLSTKKHWSNSEYTVTLSAILKDFRKEMYNSITKKLKRQYKRSSFDESKKKYE